MDFFLASHGALRTLAGSTVCKVMLPKSDRSDASDWCDSPFARCSQSQMKSQNLTSLLLAATMALTPAALAADAQPKPLIHAHAHNDYEHARPLLDALDHGFCSVEADIYLVEDKLLVAHNRKDVKPERTLQSLYLDPLRERVKRNGGRVFRDGPECVLLIDLKTNWKTIYPVLRSVLTNYADI